MNNPAQNKQLSLMLLFLIAGCTSSMNASSDSESENYLSPPSEKHTVNENRVGLKNRLQLRRDLFPVYKDYAVSVRVVLPIALQPLAYQLKDVRLRNTLLDLVPVGTVPSVVMYAFIQPYVPRALEETKNTTLQAAVDVTIHAGAFICTFTHSIWGYASYQSALEQNR
ncbi:hypothetical protein F5890DRAFT_1560486 [Lentinula detonsa]|uniref:Uncharacterized protein n=1 Tax=Lentinula detonsa TaxID=2804962 RepID=A0AA38PMM0_9AGAR|nr:hypothetical protein F5890DRAFT_1560486 [Lentinula detonsa]